MSDEKSKEEESSGGFSFADLTSDEAVDYKIDHPEPEPERPAHHDELPDVDHVKEEASASSVIMGEYRKPQIDDVAKINEKMLGASASQGTPQWMKGAGLGGFAFLLMLIFQPWSAGEGSYLPHIILVVSVIGVLYNGHGLMLAFAPPNERYRCGIGLGLGAIVTVVTGLSL